MAQRGKTIVVECILSVWGKQYTVTAHQSSRTVWIARGDYEGQHVEVKGRSAASAIALWQKTAELPI